MVCVVIESKVWSTCILTENIVKLYRRQYINCMSVVCVCVCVCTNYITSLLRYDDSIVILKDTPKKVQKNKLK